LSMFSGYLHTEPRRAMFTAVLQCLQASAWSSGRVSKEHGMQLPGQMCAQSTRGQGSQLD
jgi:hypothetical protein